MLSKIDIERITEGVLRELRIEVKSGDFTDPNGRTILLKYKDNVLSTTNIDITTRPEYDG